MRLLALVIAALPSLAQTVCPPAPAWSPCEIAFDLSEQEAAAHPNLYLGVQIEIEFRSPRYRTFRMPAFWDGGRRFLVRFTPTDPGDWVFRVNSNIARFEGKELKFSATESKFPGFLRPANVHHWAWVDDNVKTPHLWMGDTLDTFPFIDRAVFEKAVDARAAQKFNHIRGVLLAGPPGPARSFVSADQPDPAVFREIDQRIRYMNGKGITADLTLAWDGNQIVKLFPSPAQRERYVRYVVSRCAGMDVTWQGIQNFERDDNGRAILREIGQALKRLDPYQHPRSTHAVMSSSSLLTDDWMDYVVHGAPDDQLGSIEHQLYAVPFVNADLGAEAGGPAGPGVDADTFRHRLWNAAMSGQYPTFANTRTDGRAGAAIDPAQLDSPAAKQMTAWFDFFSRTRYWELEPYFDVDGGRALALERPDDESLEGIEYIVYVEKPGPVELVVQRRGYDVAWFNPVSGEYLKQKKGFKGDRFTGEPPDRSHDWVLHVYREGRLEGMLRSYKFDSRPIIMQEVEQNPQRAPFEIAEPATDPASVSKPPKYAAKVTRQTRATRSMMWLWTGEVAAGQQGVRVLGTGPEGVWTIPSNLATSYPANLAVRLYGMNALGKVYSLIRVYRLEK
jgi:hypothetical protein